MTLQPSFPAEPLGDADIEAIRDWSENGVPTSSRLVLGLIARIDRLRLEVSSRREQAQGSLRSRPEEAQPRR